MTALADLAARVAQAKAQLAQAQRIAALRRFDRSDSFRRAEDAWQRRIAILEDALRARDAMEANHAQS